MSADLLASGREELKKMNDKGVMAMELLQLFSPTLCLEAACDFMTSSLNSSLQPLDRKTAYYQAFTLDLPLGCWLTAVTPLANKRPEATTLGNKTSIFQELSSWSCCRGTITSTSLASSPTSFLELSGS